MPETEKDIREESWGAKFISPLVEEVEAAVKNYGYLSISEFLREAVREKLTYMKARESNRLLDYFIRVHKITPSDLKEAIGEVFGKI